MGQVRLRAARMGLSDAPVALGAATCVEDILSTLDMGPPPGIIAIDSIQTIWTSALEAAPGTIAQVRTASFDLVRYAKSTGAALLLVGHVTKEGQIAGPKAGRASGRCGALFRGRARPPFPCPARGEEPLRRHRRDRRVRNDRHGAGGGSQSLGAVPGRPHRPGARRRRCLPGWKAPDRCWCEIQALVAPPGYGTPRRAVVGWDSGRLAMILAVLDARAGLGITGHDVYLNVAGGLKIAEPAADLAAAAALISSFSGAPLAAGLRVFRRNQPVGRCAAGPAGASCG